MIQKIKEKLSITEASAMYGWTPRVIRILCEKGKLTTERPTSPQGKILILRSSLEDHQKRVRKEATSNGRTPQ